MWHRLIGISIFVFIVIAGVGKAEEKAPPKFSTRVRVTVSADEVIAARATSYVNRELRALGDVELVDTDPDWQLNVIAMQVTTGKDKAVAGIALSAVVMQRSPLGMSIDMMKDWDIQYTDVQKGYLGFLATAARGTYTVVSSKLRVAPPEGLQDLCDAVAADFDTTQLEPERKRWRSIVDTLNLQETPKKP